MSLHFHKTTDNHPAIPRKNDLTFAQKCADILTVGMGSWMFLIIFLFSVGFWITFFGLKLKLDPFPFILLNLALSLVSALQAPIIMMSQNRQTESDRIAAKYDYAVNRRVDREVQNMQKDLEEIKDLIRGIQKKKPAATKASANKK